MSDSLQTLLNMMSQHNDRMITIMTQQNEMLNTIKSLQSRLKNLELDLPDIPVITPKCGRIKSRRLNIQNNLGTPIITPYESNGEEEEARSNSAEFINHATKTTIYGKQY
uniref:Reverse transcriptase domain-containing protein n=1 Tax=Parastrongyloides trichosuri TaxID=131310 RepID=A0A0N4ZZQ3_PARTI